MTEERPESPADAISIRRYAARWGLSRTTVYKYLEAGLVVIAWRHGRTVRVQNQPPLTEPSRQNSAS